MFEIEADKSKNLMKMVFTGPVTVEEIKRWREKLDVLINDLKPGFRLLSDLSRLDSMDPECATDIEWSMDRLNEACIAKVVRIIPDPSKDIGFNIMSHFHYRRGVSIVTCETMDEALQALAD